MFSALAGLYSHPADDNVISQVYYWSYMFVAFFVMLNALLAIIIEAYSSVVSEHAEHNPDPIVYEGWLMYDTRHIAAGSHAVHLDVLETVLDAWVGGQLDQRELVDRNVNVLPHAPGSEAVEEQRRAREAYYRALWTESRKKDAEKLCAGYACLAKEAPDIDRHAPPCAGINH